MRAPSDQRLGCCPERSPRLELSHRVSLTAHAARRWSATATRNHQTCGHHSFDFVSAAPLPLTYNETQEVSDPCSRNVMS